MWSTGINMTQLLQVLGFSRAVCYGCRGWAGNIEAPWCPHRTIPGYKCAMTYDQMNECYQNILKDGENPELAGEVKELMSYIAEMNKQ
jgi:hypothetical protein